MFLHFRGNSGEGTEIFDIEAGQELSLGTDCAATKNIGRKFTGRAGFRKYMIRFHRVCGKSDTPVRYIVGIPP